MENILIVPVQVDALFVQTDRMVVNSTADFSMLPYTTPEVDVHPNNPYISEEIVSKPFQNTNLPLSKGVHLHWTLPDALTAGRQVKVKGVLTTKFPTVPNRWLIRKIKNKQVLNEWVVLSDYLHPEGEGEESVCIPYSPNPAKKEYKPFRFLGKTIPLAQYLKEDKSHPTYNDLTVFGYGEPTFAAFYPNCHSVFGFHDPIVDPKDPAAIVQDLTIQNIKGLSYEVFGWYENEAKDFLTTQLKSIKKEDKKWDHILDILKWSPNLTHSDWSKKTEDRTILPLPPKEMICYASIVLKPTKEVGTLKENINGESAKIAVGITGTEALSAYLGQSLSPPQQETINQVVDLSKDARSEKQIIEDQMEALLIGSNNSEGLDTGARFRQLRHEKGFTAEEGGDFWFLQKEGDQILDQNLLDSKWPDYLDLKDNKLAALNHSWDTIRDAISEVNKHHLEYDNARILIESKKEQLFADWYKYMICAYPPENSWDSTLDMDDVRFFIEKAGLYPLKELQLSVGKLIIKKAGDQKIYKATAKIEGFPNEALDSQAGKLSKKINALVLKINAHNALLIQFVKLVNSNLEWAAKEAKQFFDEKEKKIAPQFILARKPRPRFYKPKDPVVLAIGPALEASNRYGRDGKNNPEGRLSCAILPFDKKVNQGIEDKSLIPLLKKISPLPSPAKWTDQPWNPIVFEWSVELLPVLNKANMSKDELDFDPEFIKNNFELLENDPDVSHKSNSKLYVPSASVYSGSSILTPNASKHMTETLKAYIEKNVLQECLANKNDWKGLFKDNADNKKKNKNFLNKMANIEYTLNWYREKRDANIAEHKDLSLNAIMAYQILMEADFQSLSQALGGFNESLLMRKETLQLKIDDPLAFNEYGDFTKDIAWTVGKAPRRAPLPQNDFNPLRAGKMSIRDLRVIDSFGQYVDLNTDNLITSEFLEAPHEDHQVLLRPRFLQAAQVHFRWLASRVSKEQPQTSEESNGLMHNNPICGWVMPNNLDNSLMIYDASGKALGAFTESDQDWKPAPGTDETLELNTDLKKWKATNFPASLNPHLYKMMFYIKSRMKEDTSFLNHFRLSIKSAIGNILPDTSAQHNSLIQLMGRPIALVRASLDLVLKAPPAIHQGWTAFQLDMNGLERETNKFTKVEFPIRIGEHGQLNDGVVGYWVEEENQFAENKFFSPSSDEVESNFIVTHIDTEKEQEEFHTKSKNENLEDDYEGLIPVNQYQTLDDTPMTVSILFDPRGKVNLTTGLLPVKTLDIPPKLYTAAMDSMEVFFVSSPHLVNDSKKISDNSFPLQLDLPKAPDYEWTFVKEENGQWVQKPVLPGVASENLFSKEKKIKEGWLKLKKTPSDSTKK